MGEPAWLGIGAQRSGTTWLTDLLTTHPDVALGTNGKKEQQLLHKVGDGRREAAEYFDLFPADGLARGEWTPQTIRHASAPGTVARHAPNALILVVLRDPVARFKSAMSLAATREQMAEERGKPMQGPWPYPVPMMVQTWSGFYADQLAAWSATIGRERMHVLVYEEVRKDPQAALDAIWRRLDLDPVPLGETVEQASSSSSKVSWEWPEGLQESLRAMYATQAGRLTDEWGLDVSSWNSAKS